MKSEIVLRFGIVTVSDRSFSGKRPDLSGPALKNSILSQGWQVLEYQIIPDEFDQIADLLISWADEKTLDVILTTGGTGFAPRDITPEATLKVVDRLAPGLVEAARAASISITSHAMISRAVAGIRKKTLIVNLPGSPKAALENLQIMIPVLPHAAQLLRDDPESERSH